MSYKIRALRPLHDFLRAEAGAGVLLLVMVPMALLWANGPFAHSYERVWSTDITLAVDSWRVSMDLHHWVNDGLMAVFFFVVGLEVKRELLDGELRDRRKALAPVFAAIGGMVVPAVIYTAVNAGGAGSSGWGIPMATDIAIVLGFLALLGDRVPLSLKTFLLTLAIVDDIGAIVVIALFYTDDGVRTVALAASCVFLGLYYLVSKWDNRPTVLVVVIALAAWWATLESGVHATLAGVALALLTPGRPHTDSDYVDAEVLADISNLEAVSETVDAAKRSVSSVEWAQHLFHPWTSYVVLPIFALANAGILVSGEALSEALRSPVALGVVLGLLVGKPVGICLFTFGAVRYLGASLPAGVRAGHVVAGSVLAAIGFTVSLFISDLAVDGAAAEAAKTAVLFASFAAGTCGYVSMRLYAARNPALRIDQR